MIESNQGIDRAHVIQWLQPAKWLNARRWLAMRVLWKIPLLAVLVFL